MKPITIIDDETKTISITASVEIPSCPECGGPMNIWPGAFGANVVLLGLDCSECGWVGDIILALGESAESAPALARARGGEEEEDA